MEDLPASHPLYGSEQSKSGFGICYQFAIKCPVSALRPQCFQGFAGFVSYSHSFGMTKMVLSLESSDSDEEYFPPVILRECNDQESSLINKETLHFIRQ